MLLIWDIHITSKHKDRIIQELSSFVEQNEASQHIVFLGDFVYHFSYDRAAILALYDFFIKLFQKWKKIYILAGNHDRLGNSFVFEEAQKAFEIIQNLTQSHQWQIHFISEAKHFEINNQKILFFPFMLEIPDQSPTEKPQRLQNIQFLQESKHKNEQKSRLVNQYLAYHLAQKPDIIIHHHYFNKTKFPGQKSQFSYKDIAINSELLEKDDIHFISGHLHQAFSIKNYLCTGSVRSTSPLEINQEKLLFKYQDNKYQAFPIRINPYLQFTNWEKITQETIIQTLQQQTENSSQNFLWNMQIQTNKSDSFALQYTNITIVWDDLNYNEIEKYIDSDAFQQVWQVKLKKQSVASSELLEKLQLSSQENQTFSQRIELLKKHLQQKFPDDYEEYKQTLQELKIL